MGWRGSRFKTTGTSRQRSPSKKATNEEIAQYLFALAKANPLHYKARAYYKAGTGVRNHPVPVQTLSATELRSIPGIGESISKKILGYNASNPPKAPEKKQKAVRTGKSSRRFTREEISRTVKKIVRNSELAHEIAGSYRRGNKTSGDVDMLVLQSEIPRWKARLSEMGAEFKDSGPKLINAVLDSMPINLRSVPSFEHWGAGLLYLTGPQAFNLYTRNEAKKQGFKLNQYGLYKNNKLIASETEESILKELNIPYISPKKR